MDRNELRFKILFEYYEEMHLGSKNGKDANQRVLDLNIPKNEKNAAQIWLIEEGYVRGENLHDAVSPIPIAVIERINSDGVKWVEHVMNAAFTKVKEEFSEIKNLSKN